MLENSWETSMKTKKQKSIRLHLKNKRYLSQTGLLLTGLALLAIWIVAGTTPSWAQDGNSAGGNNIFLPLVISNNSNEISNESPNAPTTATESYTIAEAVTDETSNAPALDSGDVGAATYCQAYVRISNYSNQNAYIYWKNSSGGETLYQTLPGGYYYWQQSYYGHNWIIRNSAGQQVKSFTVNSCNYIYISLYNNDFPQTAPTPVVCDARIDRIRFIDTTSGLPVAGLDPIQNGAAINLANLPATYTLEAVAVGSTESVKFNTNGDQITENVAPYNYPPTGANWSPSAGSYTVVAEAYNQDNGGGQRCDTKQVSFTLVNAAPTATATPIPPTATAAPTTPPTTCTGNLANNGGFENGFNGWTVAGYSDAQLTLSGDANSGSQAALLRGTGGVYISQPINVIGGATYSLTAYGKTTNAAIYSGVGLNFYDINGTRVGQAQAQITSATYNAVTASFMAPINTAYIDLYLYTDGGIDFLSDDLCVTRSGGPTPTLTPGPDSAKLGDRVWLDANRDGVQDEGGAGLEGITVELLAGCTDTTAAASRVTSNSGQYLFTNLAPGQYRVRFIAPNGYIFTAKDQRAEPSDSDAGADGITDCFTLAAGQENYDIDAGVYDPNSAIPTPTPTATPLGGYIGDRVWNDLNRDGIQSDGEPSLQGVTVELFQGCTISGSPLQSKVTSNSGQYLFNDLLPGQYRVRVTAPAGLVFSPQNAGGDDNGDSDVDSSGVTACITLDAFEQDPSVDAGLYNPNGTIPTPTSTPTPAGGYIGDRVWNDLNQDGIQSAGEPSFQGVTVELFQGCTISGPALQSKVTSNSGQYIFTPLSAGAYLVKVTVPAGYVVSPQYRGSDSFSDSNSDSSGLSTCINLGAFEENPSVDIGLYNPALPTPTITPVGPTATATNTPAAPTATPTNTAVVPTATNTPVPPTATPTNTPVPPTATPTNTPIPSCDARIDRFRMVNFDTGIPVNGLDGIANGATINFASLPARFNLEAVTVGSAESVRFTVNGDVRMENVAPYNYPGTDEDWNPTAGSYTIIATVFNADNGGGVACETKQLSITLTGTRKASVGGRVWNDGNRNGVRESNENGMSGVAVNLWQDTNNDGHHDTRVATTTTDGNGNYSFSNLQPGVVYVVKFSLPWWGRFTTPNIGSDATDSDVVIFSYGGTANLIFAVGENNRTTDAGIY